jgi:Family of unknown function (DUF6941)
MALQIVGFFCEDIREEKSGQDTIIGILPDNLQVAQTPGMIPKLGVYIRFLLDKDDAVKSINIRVAPPASPEMPIGDLGHLIEQAKAEAASRDMPYAGMIAKAIMAPFPVFAPGRIAIIVRVDGVDRVCAVLNVVSAGPTPTASPELSEQSSTAVS